MFSAYRMNTIKNTFLSCIIIFSVVTLGLAQQESIAVFVSGNEGHKSYRIPAIIDLPNGDLLAFAEGRVHGSGDYGDVNIVLKRSSDKGKTWTALQTVVDYDVLQAGNPAPVVDLTDPAYPNGRIFLFYNTGNNHENEVRKGNGLREVWYKTSVDGGVTWSDPVNITTQTHKPLNTQANAAYNFTEEWRSYANTPGHAMQFQSGKYKGRIYVAANHSVGDPERDATDYVAHGFYTDDHGKTFQIGDNLNLPGSNESIAAEISGGRLMFNSRNQKGDVRARIVAISSNGGQSWDTTYFDNNLPDPVCQGSILTLGTKKEKSILAFCNAADEKKRNNLTLRISYDDGNTWAKNFVIYNNPEKNDAAAYSDIVKTGKNSVGILFEKDGYSQIVFTTLKWK
ncbi:MAG TPA: sialidase family protein [Cyclobacteriaceae bacterium]|jgi:sialidase-1|nr:sialidase family protein [Cyclobacteriaceae bacterium]HRF32666.1 sialidase family protein [Cyclobacteriaceae bacterium]